MKLTRRDMLPLLCSRCWACCRFPGQPSTPAPEPVRTRLILGGDVMLSRHVGKVARGRAIRPFPCAILLLCSSRPISRS